MIVVDAGPLEDGVSTGGVAGAYVALDEQSTLNTAAGTVLLLLLLPLLQAAIRTTDNRINAKLRVIPKQQAPCILNLRFYKLFFQTWRIYRSVGCDFKAIEFSYKKPVSAMGCGFNRSMQHMH